VGIGKKDGRVEITCTKFIKHQSAKGPQTQGAVSDTSMKSIKNLDKEEQRGHGMTPKHYASFHRETTTHRNGLGGIAR